MEILQPVGKTNCIGLVWLRRRIRNKVYLRTPKAIQYPMITESAYLNCAKFLQVEPAAIMAVADVESGGNGMIDNKPTLLYEPHIFWRELQKRGIDPNAVLKSHPDYHDILYQKWGTRPYPSGQNAKWLQLDKAAKINREAALCSASFGKFQIMGFNHKACDCDTVQEFVNDMYAGEDRQLYRFGCFIHNNGYDVYLRKQQWAKFALKYNGAGYTKNHYDTKLQNAYNKYK